MCGIFGQITNSPKKIEVSSFNILGLYNIERGKSSCGITYDGEIYHSFTGNHLYSDFIKKRKIEPVKSSVIFGHTRQPSAGSVVSPHNIHPFGYGSKNDSYEMVFVHNGTLKNHRELAKKYDVETSIKEVGLNNVITYRTKIDSEILGEILFKTKNFKVLSEYYGTAACVWSWPEEPNKVYIFSGKSKKTVHSVEETEERPLCVFLKSKNNMFFSSILESLYAIGGKDENCFQIDYNTVYCITDGDFKNAQTWKITRNKVAQEEPITVHSTNYSFSQNQTLFTAHRPASRNPFDKETAEKEIDYLDLFEISKEKPLLDISSYQNKVYFNKFRYWCSDVKINGVYLYVIGYGFVFLTNSVDPNLIKLAVNSIKNKVFNRITGKFDMDSINSTGKYIPFLNTSEPTLYYFFEGIRLKQALDYFQLQSNRHNFSNLDVKSLSEAAEHPIFDLTGSDRTAYKGGKLFNSEGGGIMPLCSEKIYYFFYGKLVKVRVNPNLKNLTDYDDFFKKPTILIPLPAPKTVDVNTQGKEVINLAGLEENTKKLKEVKNFLVNQECNYLLQIKQKEQEVDQDVDLEEEMDVEEIISNIYNESLTDCFLDIINTKKKITKLKEKHPKNKKLKENEVALENIIEAFTTINSDFKNEE